jgi:hypothetical protein
LAKAQTKTGAGAIRDIWAASREALSDMASAVQADPDPNLPRAGVKPGQWQGAPHDAMPPDCPVQVIGRDGDGVIWCRNATGDLRSIGPKDWTMSTISDLFSPYINYAFWAWPAFGKEKKTDQATGEVTEILVVKRVERDKLFTCLGNEASKKPLFDPAKQHRGRGGWADSNGNFIWHSGKHLFQTRGHQIDRAQPQEHDGFLYTRQPETIRPWNGRVAAEESPAIRILQQLRTWNWERPYLDPMLALGYIPVGLMGGALKARPHIFTTGGAGVGKSTLHQLFRQVLNGVVFATVDTTAAGIYQRMKQDALPVMVDELENKPGSSKATSVIELARVAYSGGEIARGGADHEGTTFQMHSSFFFSAINLPQMGIQDRTRLAILNLARLDAPNGTGAGMLTKVESDGPMILRQVMDGWERFNKELMPKWWEVLAGQGLDSRAIDTYGTLLAACELVVGWEAMEQAGLPVTELDKLGQIIGAATAPDRAEQLDNWHRCVIRLLQSTIDAWRDGQRPTVGGVMDQLARQPMATDVDLEDARKRLELVNLSVRGKGDGPSGQPSAGPFLAVPHTGPQLAKLFAGTEWEGQWSLALKQGVKSGVVINDRGKGQVKINGANLRCLLIDWQALKKYEEGQT